MTADVQSLLMQEVKAVSEQMAVVQHELAAERAAKDALHMVIVHLVFGCLMFMLTQPSDSCVCMHKQ